MEGKVALISGSTQGIGLGIARKLASHGCSIILTGLASQEETGRLIQDFTNKYAGSYHFVPGDLRDHASTADMCTAINNICPVGIDILINNAGWGRIVNTTSQMGMISQVGKTPYSATKAGIIGFTKGDALESAENGITCNSICPGFVETDIVKAHVEHLANEEKTKFRGCQEYVL